MSAAVYILPVTHRSRAAYHDLRGSGLSAAMAVELVALLECLRPVKRPIALRQTLGFDVLSAADAHAWLLARNYGEQRPRRVGRWGRLDAGGAP